MKQRFLLLLTLTFAILAVLMVTLTSCSTTKLKESEFSDEESVGPAVFSVSDNTSTGLTLEITNTSSEYSLEYFRDERRGYDNGHGYRLEQKIGDNWYALNVIIDDTTISTIAYWLLIGPRETEILELSWEYLYGELSPGEYRMLFRLSVVDGFDDNDKPVYIGDFYIPIYFEIE